jgi:DUF1680 family protein
MLPRLRIQRRVLVPYFFEQTHDALRAARVASRMLNTEGQLVPAELKLVPYYAWNNRGVGSMAVWLPNDESTLRRDGVIRQE